MRSETHRRLTVETVFEDSHIPISKWLLAIHLLASSKKGISAHQLHRNLGISYKGAWFMAHRLRWARADGGVAEMLSGTVEVDETYIGGKKIRGTKRGRPGPDSHKTPVVALVERRTGKVRAMPMERITSENLRKAMQANISASAHIMTDELPAYRFVPGSFVDHQTVDHGRDEYVRGNAHVNTAEGFFSLLKRAVNAILKTSVGDSPERSPIPNESTINNRQSPTNH